MQLGPRTPLDPKGTSITECRIVIFVLGFLQVEAEVLVELLAEFQAEAWVSFSCKVST